MNIYVLLFYVFFFGPVPVSLVLFFIMDPSDLQRTVFWCYVAVSIVCGYIVTWQGLKRGKFKTKKKWDDD